MGSESTSAIHPQPAELLKFARGALDGMRVAVIEGHVYRCRCCADFVAKAPSDGFVEQLRASRDHWSIDVNSGNAASKVETVGLPLEEFATCHLPAELRNHPRFEIKRYIAEGGMGRVYLAQRRNGRVWIAVKVLRPELACDPRRLSRFLQEARLAEKLHHPNIVQVLECDSAGAAAYLMLEFVRGKTLAQIVASRGPLPFVEAREFLRQAASGLACAASHGVVHRDIKPHNLMYQPLDGLIKILDFGLGRLVDDQRTGSRLTREGDIVGTLDYISPEQAANSRDADVRSDIYSLGCTFYFLLAGAPPFQGKNPIDLLKKHELEQPIPIQSLRHDVSMQIADLLNRMLQKDPDLRPQTPEEVLALLDCELHMNQSTDGDATRPVNAGPHDCNDSRLICFVASPSVLLPVLTVLGCILWRML